LKPYLFILLCLCSQAFAFDATNTAVYFDGTAAGSKYSEWFYLDGPTPTGTNTIMRDRLRVTNDASGFLRLTNPAAGNYRAEFHGKFTITTNWYSIPQTNADINLNDPQWSREPTNGIMLALTLGAGDARYFINGGINDLSLRDLGNNMEGYWKIHTDGDGLWLTNNQTGGWMLLTSGGTLLLSDHLLDSAENLTNLNASALSLGIIPAGRINTLAGGIGWLTNSTLPNNTTTIRAWLTVTNDSGKVGKLPVYY
jgi:hypothetical protein